jgi:hypothetical protein
MEANVKSIQEVCLLFHWLNIHENIMMKCFVCLGIASSFYVLAKTTGVDPDLHLDGSLHWLRIASMFYSELRPPGL